MLPEKIVTDDGPNLFQQSQKLSLRKWSKTYFSVELGGTQILETVWYFIKYHGINNYHGILINTFMYPVKYSNNFS